MADKLGARRDSGWKAVCTAPDFCKTPVGSSTPPIPYQVFADLGQSKDCVTSVRFNEDPCKVLDRSVVPSCTGDEPGTAKGVRSGTVAGKVKPTDASSTVRAEGKRVVREGDPCTLNSGNCPGVYVTQPAPGCTIGVDGLPAAKEAAEPPGSSEEIPAGPDLKGLWGKLSGPVHFMLGAAGFIPGLGAIPDLIDAGVYALEGDAASAVLSLGAAVPLAGDALKAGTVVGKAGKQVAKVAAEKAAKEAPARAAKEAIERAEKEAAARAANEGVEKRAKKEAGEAAEGTHAAGKVDNDGVKVKEKKKKIDKCQSIAGGVPGADYRGGRYGTLYPGGAARGQESHHIPAAAASGGARLDKPAIQMDKTDHQRTASWDNQPGAAAFRNRQKALLSMGKKGMLAAMAMDIADIRSKFGDKYDAAIAQMIAWTKCKEYI